MSSGAQTTALWKEVRERLESERNRVHDEITAYPPPIPACDAQFNHLLEARSGIARVLKRMAGVSHASLDDCRALLDELGRSELLSRDVLDELRARI